MAQFLQKHECLVLDGYAALRGPDGKLVEGVPQYRVACLAEVDPELVVFVGENEAVISAGLQTRPGEKQAAQERYEMALKAGVRPSLSEISGEALYIKVDSSEKSRVTGLSKREEAACREIVASMAAEFRKAMEKLKG